METENNNQQKQEVKVIDISRWNEFLSYIRARRAGVERAIVKVNNAGNVPDQRFYEHVNGLKAAGIQIIGGYNYSYANTVEKAKKAADSFVNIAKPEGIDTMWLDLEDTSMKGLGGNIVKIINAYRHIAEQAGMKFGIYTGASFFNPYLSRYMSELKGIPFWWARYPNINERKITDSAPSTKYLPTNLDLSGWQYSSKGVIDGIKGYVDLSVWYNLNPTCNKEVEITVERNPFTEPIYNVKVGTTGNDANWVLWYLWRFGKLLDTNGIPDQRLINGVIEPMDVDAIKSAQSILGLEADGIVGKRTRAVWRKVC